MQLGLFEQPLENTSIKRKSMACCTADNSCLWIPEIIYFCEFWIHPFFIFMFKGTTHFKKSTPYWSRILYYERLTQDYTLISAIARNIRTVVTGSSRKSFSHIFKRFRTEQAVKRFNICRVSVLKIL